MELIELINSYEKKNNTRDISVQIYANGAGILWDENDIMLFSFNEYEDLIEFLKNNKE
tara:strand:+ start:55 stop:228 length:174 start_codon:yes stop_codon:yes gene_type:complete